MNTRARIAVASLSGLGALCFTALTASAAIVCNDEGDCWHVHESYQFSPDLGLTIHQDGWKWKETEHFTWREHPGRGYWRHGQWEVLP